MKFIVIPVVVALLAGCADDPPSILTGTASLIGGGARAGIEVRAYGNLTWLTKNDLLAKTRTDGNGNFSLEIPPGGEIVRIHVSYPNYDEFSTVYILDDSPGACLEASLQAVSVSEKVSRVSVVGNFCDSDFRKAVEMTEEGDGLFVAEVDFDGPLMMYQLIFDTESHTYSNPVKGERYRYDHNGDYQNVVAPDDGTCRIAVNLADFPRYAPEEGPPSSTGAFASAPLSRQLENAVATLDQCFRDQLGRGSQIVMMPVDPGASGGVTEEDLAREKEKRRLYLEQKAAFVDSLLETAAHRHTIDFLLASRLAVLESLGRATFEEKWSIFERIEQVPMEYQSIYVIFLTTTQFRQHPDEYLKYIEMKLKNTRPERLAHQLRHNYYEYLFRKLNSDGRNSARIRVGLKSLLSGDDIPDHIATRARWVLDQL